MNSSPIPILMVIKLAFQIHGLVDSFANHPFSHIRPRNRNHKDASCFSSEYPLSGKVSSGIVGCKGWWWSVVTSFLRNPVIVYPILATDGCRHTTDPADIPFELNHEYLKRKSVLPLSSHHSREGSYAGVSNTRHLQQCHNKTSEFTDQLSFKAVKVL